jgi:hypothetical protein
MNFKMKSENNYDFANRSQQKGSDRLRKQVVIAIAV